MLYADRISLKNRYVEDEMSWIRSRNRGIGFRWKTVVKSSKWADSCDATARSRFRWKHLGLSTNLQEFWEGSTELHFVEKPMEIQRNHTKSWCSAADTIRWKTVSKSTKWDEKRARWCDKIPMKNLYLEAEMTESWGWTAWIGFRLQPTGSLPDLRIGSGWAARTKVTTKFIAPT